MTVNTLPNAFARSSSPTVAGPRLYLREDELDLGVSLIFQAGDLLKAATEEQRRHYALSWAETRCLCDLLVQPQAVLKLAASLGMTKQAMLKTLETLEARAWIVRQEDSRDGRRKIVHLTGSGHNVATELALAMRSRLAAAYRVAGSEAVTGCDKVLTALTETPSASNTMKSKPNRAP